MKYVKSSLIISLLFMVAPIGSAWAGGHVGVNVHAPGTNVHVGVGWGKRPAGARGTGYSFFNTRDVLGNRAIAGFGGGNAGFANKYGACMNGACCFWGGGCF